MNMLKAIGKVMLAVLLIPITCVCIVAIMLCVLGVIYIPAFTLGLLAVIAVINIPGIIAGLSLRNK